MASVFSPLEVFRHRAQQGRLMMHGMNHRGISLLDLWLRMHGTPMQLDLLLKYGFRECGSFGKARPTFNR